MKILIFGANGFIGRHLHDALHAAGHDVWRGVRNAKGPTDLAIDFTHCLHASDLLPLVRGADVVINAVGILNESPATRFDEVHRNGPIALFDACEQAGVPRLIQVSALGGAASEQTPYMRSKRAADAHLMRSSLTWTILRPSLVVGADGASSVLFRTLASLPLIGLPGRGEQALQPVHIDDLSAAVLKIVESGGAARQIVDVVGSAPMTYRAMLQHYRDAMGMGKAVWLPIPMPLMQGAARIAQKLPGAVLTPDTLRMLEQGNVADPGSLARLLGRAPLGPESWFRGLPPQMLRAEAVNHWSVPLLRVVLALVWIVTGILSLGVYPLSGSLELLGQVGLHGIPALVALYTAALMDVTFGVATLFAPSRRLWWLQAAVMLGYTMIISVFLPAFWLHPFGPLLKNLPILAILIALDAHQAKSR